jgi:hypothetical protein
MVDGFELAFVLLYFVHSSGEVTGYLILMKRLQLFVKRIALYSTSVVILLCLLPIFLLLIGNFLPWSFKFAD